MRKNKALANLRAGKVSIGPLFVFESNDAIEQAAHLGFDWIWLDWQHGEFSEHTINGAIARFLATDCTPLVRVKSHEPGTINRALDMGAMGVIVPMVQNAAQAKAVADATFYPPMGWRSGGGNRLSLIGGSGPQEYFDRSNDEMMLVVMVETEEAIANVQSIMEVPGISAVIIGPGDLMIDVKAHGHDEAHHEALVLQVAAASKRTGVPAGYVCGTREMTEKRIAQGFRFLNYGSDVGVLARGLKEIAEQVKGWE